MNWSLRHQLPLWVRLCLVTAMFAGLVAASLTPGLAPSGEHGIDLFVHSSVYLLVTVFTLVLVERPLLSATAILALSGAIEVLQNLVPGRTGAWGDFAANGLGIVVALAVLGLMGVLGFRVTRENLASQEANAPPVE